MKICNHCKKELSIDNYHHDYSQKDTYSKTCKQCRKTWRDAKGLEHQRKVNRIREKRDREEMNDKYWKKMVRFHNWRAKNKELDYLKIKTIFQGQKEKCFFCGVKLNSDNLNLEHYYPKRSDKIVISCCDCNRLKWQRNGDDFKNFLKEYISRF